MKTEDIDKKIGMPDVDKEWARFEQEVIGKGTRTGKSLWIIAASIIIAAGLFLLRYDYKEQEQRLAEHLAEQEKPVVTTNITEEQVEEPQAESIDRRSQLAQTAAPRLQGTQNEEAKVMRLRGIPELTPELQGQIAGLPPIDIRRMKKDYRRTLNKQAPDTILTLVNGKEDEAFLQYLHELPYWSMAFVYDYFFQRNQLFLRQKSYSGDEAKSYAHLFNGRDIRLVIDYLTMPYKPVSQFTPDELKARRLAYLLRCYREGKNSQDNHGMFSPDLFDTHAEERLFGLLGMKCSHGYKFDERFGHVSRDSRGTYIPLERYTKLTMQDAIWEENGEWLGMEDDERFNAVIKDLDEAANGASSSLVLPGDSIVGMAFIYGGKVTKGAPLKVEKLKSWEVEKLESSFEFTPDEDTPSYWTAEVYYSTHFPRHMVVYLRSVDKLYASECPDILNIHYRRLKGIVQNEEGKPIGHATVGYRDRPYFSDGVSADSLGRFELMLPNHIDTIRASWISYQTQKIRVLPTDSVLTIRLRPLTIDR